MHVEENIALEEDGCFGPVDVLRRFEGWWCDLGWWGSFGVWVWDGGVFGRD